jgi:predicted outer membrane repeat protein
MRRIGFLAATVLVFSGLSTPAVFADDPRTVYVRPDSTSADSVTGTSCLLPNYSGSNGLKNALINAVAGDTVVLCNDTLYGNSPANRTFSLSNTTLTVPVTLIPELSNQLRRPKIVANNFQINTDPQVETSISAMNFVISQATGSGTDCTTTAACGGAIELKSGILSLNRMLFKDNGAKFGGAIALTSGAGSATLEVDRSSFINNSAETNGGAIFVSTSDQALITNSVFYENKVTSGNGTVVFANSGTANLNFNTIVNNSGGTVLQGEGVSLSNSILGQRLLSEDLCGDTVNIGDGNFITDDSCGDLPEYSPGTQDISVHIPFGQMRIGRIYETNTDGLQYFRVLSESPVIDYITFDEELDPSTNISSLTSNRPYSVESVEPARADVGAVEVDSTPLLVREFDSELTYAGLIIAEKLSVGGTMIPTSTTKVMTPMLTYDVTKKRVDNDGNAIITTQERHDITVGMQIEVSGVGSGLNGLHRVTAVSSRSFTFSTNAPSLAESVVSPWGSAVHKEKANIIYTSLTPEICTLVSVKNPAIIPQVNSGVCEIEIYSPAVNGYEEVSEFISLQMLIQTKSSKPLNVTTSKILKNGVTVSWQRPFTTGKAKLLRYEVSFYRQSKPKEVRLTVKVSPYKLSAKISKLAVNMPYIVRVRAITAAGTSSPSTDVLFKTKKK